MQSKVDWLLVKLTTDSVYMQAVRCNENHVREMEVKGRVLRRGASSLLDADA